MTIESQPLEILVETYAMLTLAEINPAGTEVGITMINKITKHHVDDAVSFYLDISKDEGSCVMI